jgi:hypothetical protein
MTMKSIQFAPDDPAAGSGGGGSGDPGSGAPAGGTGGAPAAVEYKFAVPQGMTVDKAVIDEFTDFAKKGKFTPEHAQTVFERQLARDAEHGKKSADAAKQYAVPDKYDLKAPQGVTLEQAALGEIEASAKALGLTQAQAQKFLEHKLAEGKEQAEFQKTFLDEQRKVWNGDLAKHPKYGGQNLTATAEHARRVLDRFAPPSLVWQGKTLPQLLEETGFGDHPLVNIVLSEVGAAMAEGKVGSGPTAPGSKRELSADEKLRNAYAKDYAAPAPA